MHTLQLDYEPVLFDDKSMFVERRRKLETVASLGDYKADLVQIKPEPEKMDVEVEKEKTTTPAQTRPPRTEVITPPGGTIVFSLFRYQAPEMVARLRPATQKLLDEVQANCPVLLDAWQRRVPQLEQALEAYTKRFIANTLARDENGTRMRVCLQQLEELYLVWGVDPRDKQPRLITEGKSNAAHLAPLQGLLKEVYDVSLNPRTDTFYEQCADTRPRGRQPRSVSENPPHPLNQLKKDYINSLKSAPPVVYDESDGRFYLAHETTQPLAATQLTVDYYPLFFKALGIVNGCVPRATNHGWFTERVRDAVHRLTPQQWPMHGLVKALCNLQGVLERRRVCVRAKPGRRYYCCYTGEELRDGEEVWLLRLVTLSAERHLKWVRQGKPPTGSKADHPDLLPSLRTFFMKTRVQGVCSVFNAAFVTQYSAHFAAQLSPGQQQLALYTGPHQQPLLPGNRRYVFNPLWRLMHRLHTYVVERRLGAVLWDATGRECYQQYRARMDTLLQQMTLKREELRYLVFTGVFGVNDVTGLAPPMCLETHKIGELVAQVTDAVLDLFDVTLDFSPGQNEWAVQHTTFALPLLLGEDSEAHLQQPLQTVVRPQLNAGTPLLHALCHHSDKRRAARCQGEPSREERLARLRRLQLCLCTHPFLALTLHDTLYTRCDQLEQLSQTDADRLMLAMRLRVCK